MQTTYLKASKYGGYFVTTDERILKKKEAMEKICAAIIVKSNELIEIINMYENE